jgi:hypothetical protein
MQSGHWTTPHVYIAHIATHVLRFRLNGAALQGGPDGFMRVSADQVETLTLETVQF